jgi:hypothetical protein
MTKRESDGSGADAGGIDVPRRRLLQATVAAGGLHALGALAADGTAAALGTDLVFADGFETVPPPVGPAGYATTFGLTQSPMIDNGGWLHGQRDAGAFRNVDTTGGRMHASAAAAGPHPESVCCRSGWNHNYQFVTAVVHRAAGYSPAAAHHVALAVGVQFGANTARLYAWRWSAQGSSQVARWNGAGGDVTVLVPTGPGITRAPVDGDVIAFEFDATSSTQVVLKAYLWTGTGWQLVHTVVDGSAQRIVLGNPGAAFLADTGDTVPSSFGLKFWSARSGVPAWLDGVAVGHWVEIPDSAMAGSYSRPVPNGIVGPRSRMDAWCGLVSKGTDFYSVRNGGHTDYWGNEVMRFRLASDQPTWEMVKPSSSFVPAAGDSNSRYGDGTPASSHSYAHHRYVRERDWFVSVGNTAVANNGGSPNECVVYDIASNDWMPVGTMPDCMPVVIANHAIWQDPARGDIYQCRARTVNRWNQATNTWTFNINDFTNQYGIAGVGCTDAYRRRALVFGNSGGGANKTILYGLDANTWVEQPIAGDQTLVGNAYFGLVFCPVTDRYYAMTGEADGGGLFEIHPTSFVCAPKPAAGASGMAADAGNGVYTRFQYVPELGGLVHFPRHSSNAWFLRLH